METRLPVDSHRATTRHERKVIVTRSCRDLSRDDIRTNSPVISTRARTELTSNRAAVSVIQRILRSGRGGGVDRAQWWDEWRAQSPECVCVGVVTTPPLSSSQLRLKTMGMTTTTTTIKKCMLNTNGDEDFSGSARAPIFWEFAFVMSLCFCLSRSIRYIYSRGCRGTIQAAGHSSGFREIFFQPWLREPAPAQLAPLPSVSISVPTYVHTRICIRANVSFVSRELGFQRFQEMFRF